MRSLLAVLVLLLATACATSGSRRVAIPNEVLLSGQALGLQPVPAATLVAPDEAMALDDDMRAFISSTIGKTSQDSIVLNQLVKGMQQKGFFTLEYVVGDTHTASETFHSKHGNCISFTLLFVALARASGLDVRYQIVQVPPVWNANAELTVIANHINALIETDSGREYIVDFNETNFNSRLRRQTIGDDHAMALFFNNLGAEAMLAMDHPRALHYFTAAVRSDDDVSDPWVNLGLLYARHGLYEHAESAYLQALDIDAFQRSALTNLANLYKRLGEYALAQEYQERIRRYQARNPYYHFVLARQAFAEDRLEDAQEATTRAIRLKHDEHDFYYLLGLTQIGLGEYAGAEQSLIRARDYAVTSGLKEKYAAALADLHEARVTDAASASR